MTFKSHSTSPPGLAGPAESVCPAGRPGHVGRAGRPGRPAARSAGIAAPADQSWLAQTARRSQTGLGRPDLARRNISRTKKLFGKVVWKKLFGKKLFGKVVWKSCLEKMFVKIVVVWVFCNLELKFNESKTKLFGKPCLKVVCMFLLLCLKVVWILFLVVY